MLIRLDGESGKPVYINPAYVTSASEATPDPNRRHAVTILHVAEGLQGAVYVVQGSLPYIVSLVNDRHEPD